LTLLLPPYPIVFVDGTLNPPLAPPPPANISPFILIFIIVPSPPFGVEYNDVGDSPTEPEPPPPPGNI